MKLGEMIEHLDCVINKDDIYFHDKDTEVLKELLEWAEKANMQLESMNLKAKNHYFIQAGRMAISEPVEALIDWKLANLDSEACD